MSVINYIKSNKGALAGIPLAFGLASVIVKKRFGRIY